jgi:hypothetical protein
MYGFNSTVIVFDDPSYNKMFYGATLGFGFDFGPKFDQNGYWSCGILFPMRSEDVNNYIQTLQNEAVELNSQLPPLTISLAYRIGLK